MFPKSANAVGLIRVRKEGRDGIRVKVVER